MSFPTCVCQTVSVIRDLLSSEHSRRHAEVSEPRGSARCPALQLRAVRSRRQTRAAPQQSLHQIHLEPEPQRSGVRIQAEAAHSDAGSAHSVVRLRESTHRG